MAWTKPSKEKHPLVRLAQIAMRMNRIRTLREVQRINTMINLHAPVIRQHPRGAEVIAKTRAEMVKLHRLLKQGALDIDSSDEVQDG